MQLLRLKSRRGEGERIVEILSPSSKALLCAAVDCAEVLAAVAEDRLFAAADNIAVDDVFLRKGG